MRVFDLKKLKSYLNRENVAEKSREYYDKDNMGCLGYYVLDKFINFGRRGGEKKDNIYHDRNSTGKIRAMMRMDD